MIGAGPGGYVCAIRLARLGVETVLVEKMPTMGGVCLNWGCIPSKAWISASRLWDDLKRIEEIGIKIENPAFDMSRLKSWKDGIVQRLTGGVSELLKRNKVKVMSGTAAFIDERTVEITGAEGKQTPLTADAFVVATGSASIQIPGLEADQRHILTSRGALDLTEVPNHLLVIGGGVIGLEIGQCFQRLGAKLTVVEMMDQLLPGIDPAFVKVVGKTLKKAKATIHLNSRAKSAAVADGKVLAVIETPKGEVKVKADKVLVAVGRRPNIAGLGLDKAGVDTDNKGFITVDDQRRTSNPAIFAIGDVAGGVLLAHKASKEGLVVAGVIAGGNEVMEAVIPAAIFTEPEISTVGLTEITAAEKGYEVKVGSFPFAASGRAMASRETAGLVKVIANATDDRLLGVHICGPHASELIAEATLALEAGLTAEDLALTVHAHPTLTETLMEAAEDVHRMAVHIYNPA